MGTRVLPDINAQVPGQVHLYLVERKFPLFNFYVPPTNLVERSNLSAPLVI